MIVRTIPIIIAPEGDGERARPCLNLRADPEPRDRDADPEGEAGEEHDPDQQDRALEPPDCPARLC